MDQAVAAKQQEAEAMKKGMAELKQARGREGGRAKGWCQRAP